MYTPGISTTNTTLATYDNFVFSKQFFTFVKTLKV